MTISLAHLTAIDADPVALINIAAEAGYDAVGLRLTKVTEDSPGYPLMHDRQLLQRTLSAIKQTGILVNDIEFIKITPELDVNSLSLLLDTGKMLGAKKLITAPYDDDLNRLSDKLAQIAELAQERDIQTLLEFFPWTSIPDYKTAHHVVSQAGSGVGILLDTLHFNRSSSRLSDLEVLGTDRISMVHLCDAPVKENYSTQELLHCAREARLPPGKGEIDLKAIMQKLPKGLPIGLEVPMAASGRSNLFEMRQVAQNCILDTNRLLRELSND